MLAQKYLASGLVCIHEEEEKGMKMLPAEGEKALVVLFRSWPTYAMEKFLFVAGEEKLLQLFHMRHRQKVPKNSEKKREILVVAGHPH